MVRRDDHCSHAPGRTHRRELIHIDPAVVDRDRDRLAPREAQDLPRRRVAARFHRDRVARREQRPRRDVQRLLAPSHDADCGRRCLDPAEACQQLGECRAEPLVALGIGVVEETPAPDTPQRLPERARQLAVRDEPQVRDAPEQEQQSRCARERCERWPRRRQIERPPIDRGRRAPGRRDHVRHERPTRGLRGDPPLGAENVERRHHGVAVDPELARQDPCGRQRVARPKPPPRDVGGDHAGDAPVHREVVVLVRHAEAELPRPHWTTS